MTAPKAARDGGRTRWHKDLITWYQPHLGLFVPFLTEVTARAVAEQVLDDTEQLMRVFRFTTDAGDEFWCYHPYFEIMEA